MHTVPRPALRTERLRLEPVTALHAPGLFEAARVSRDELLPWMPWAREMTLEAHSRYASEAVKDWKADREFHFAIRGGDVILGLIGLNRDGPQGAELHYWIRSDRAGRGYVTEAARELLRWGVATLGVEVFTLWAGVENQASRRVAEKLGFRDVGPLTSPMAGGLGEFVAEGYELRAADRGRHKENVLTV